MRTLKFIVDGQNITQDPSCDFSGLVPGTKGYLRAEFSFVSSDWVGCIRAASFFNMMGKEYCAKMINYNDGTFFCIIPNEALEKRRFKIQVMGAIPATEYLIKTNKVTVCQDGR